MEIEESISGTGLPFLVGGSTMPKKEELPEKVQRLSRRQGIELKKIILRTMLRGSSI